jgi:hypothetical protein
VCIVERQKRSHSSLENFKAFGDATQPYLIKRVVGPNVLLILHDLL